MTNSIIKVQNFSKQVKNLNINVKMQESSSENQGEESLQKF